MGYDYGYDMLGSATARPSMGLGALIWIIIAFVISLVGCFIVYFMFVKKDGKEKNKTLAWLKDFLRFDKMLIETILKVGYIFTTLFLTLGSFALISVSFVGFLLTLIFGNLLARIIYESALIKIMIWKNTTEIKKNMK